MTPEPKPGEWIDRYGDYLYSIAFLKLRNRETAEDLVQETFLAAFRSLPDFKGMSSERTWLTAILNNKIIDYVRKKDVLKEVSVYLSETEASFFQSFFDSSAETNGHWRSGKGPAQWIVDPGNESGVEFSAAVASCAAKLPGRLSSVFLARFIDEEDSDKICKQFSISPSNYWVILHRGKLLMRDCLSKLGFGNR